MCTKLKPNKFFFPDRALERERLARERRRLEGRERLADVHGSPGHGADHVLPLLAPPTMTVPVVGGTLALGTWQSIALLDPNADNATRTMDRERTMQQDRDMSRDRDHMGDGSGMDRSSGMDHGSGMGPGMGGSRR